MLVPNIALQRTAPCGLAAELGSFGPGGIHHPAFRLAVVLALILALPGIFGATEPTQRQKYVPKKGDFALECTLFNGDPPGVKGTLQGIPITYDPHIILGAHVESVRFGKSPWNPGANLRFLIHSPSLLFGGYGFSGHRFVLTFSPFHPGGDNPLFEPETKFLLKSIDKASSE